MLLMQVSLDEASVPFRELEDFNVILLKIRHVHLEPTVIIKVRSGKRWNDAVKITDNV